MVPWPNNALYKCTIVPINAEEVAMVKSIQPINETVSFVPSDKSSFASVTGTFIKRRAIIGMSRRKLRLSRGEFIFEMSMNFAILMVTLSVKTVVCQGNFEYQNFS